MKSTIYTRKGDQGTTALFGGQRTDKNDARVEALGAVDELNASIGIVVSMSTQQATNELLQTIQHQLFTFQAMLANPGDPKNPTKPPHVIKQSHIDFLEKQCDAFDTCNKKLSSFTPPGGHPIAAHLQYCRVLTRKAERRIISLHRQSPLVPESIAYINRLSDLFFVLARYMNRLHGVSEDSPRYQ